MVDQALSAHENAPPLIDPRTRPMLPVGKQALATLEAFGLPAVCDLVMAGHAQTRIAAMLGVSQPSLAGWLGNQRGVGAALYSDALRASAESLLDEARAVIEAAAPTTPAVMQARAVADLLIKKAGIRNRAYRDRIDSGVALVDMGSDQPAQALTFVLVIHPQREDLGRLIEHEGDG